MIGIDGIAGGRSGERQSEAGECGLACLATVAQHHGDRTGLAVYRRRYPVSSRGLSLKNLVGIADRMGFHSRPLRSDISSLAQVSLPAILHWDLNHFVVLEAIKQRGADRSYRIFDPASGHKTLCTKDLSEHFTGIALELTPGNSFTPARQRPRLRLNQLWSRVVGLGPALGRVLILSMMMQFVALIVPFYTQVAIDTALPSSDLDLLNIVAMGFAALLLLNAAVTWVRARLTITLTNSLGMQMALNLLRHTLFLPMDWFEKRHLGDVVSRFGSLQPINDLLSRGLVNAVVDGALALTTIVMMMLYSPLLALLTIALVAIYGIVKLAFFKSMKLANANVLTAQAIENSAFIENVRGIGAIKLFCQEGNRQRLWQNKKADVVNGTIRLGRLTSGFDTVNGLVVGLENILFIYAAITMAMTGALTLGMLFAFQAYKQNFVGATTRLIDQLLSYRLLDVHLDRLSDIALEAREPHEALVGETHCRTIELRNISFSYGDGLPFVLKDISVKFAEGKTTAIIGPSGCGKTTLLKIIAGLLQPTSGVVLVDGVPIRQFGLRNYRDRLGVVSQEDTLFAGSIIENIAFFDPDYDVDWVRRCCAQAAIHDDIMAMPMRYDTMVGDMGSNLSGGQKQRVLLARALYKSPDLLIMDEGTAHLDIRTEMIVADALQSLAITRLMVAHRPETIRRADFVVTLGGASSASVTSPQPNDSLFSNTFNSGAKWLGQNR